MPSTIDDIRDKLSRTDKHIDELEREIEAFLNEEPYRSIANYDAETAKAFRDSWKNRGIPPKFRIVVGEVLYQLRSSLDHVAAALVVADGGSVRRQTAFPIFRSMKKPEDRANYRSAIKGIRRRRVRAIIRKYQPHTRRDQRWLETLRTMNNTDKHSALVLCVPIIQPRLKTETLLPDEGSVLTSDRIDVHEGTELAVPMFLGGDVIEVVNVQRRRPLCSVR